MSEGLIAAVPDVQEGPVRLTPLKLPPTLDVGASATSSFRGTFARGKARMPELRLQIPEGADCAKLLWASGAELRAA